MSQMLLPLEDLMGVFATGLEDQAPIPEDLLTPTDLIQEDNPLPPPTELFA